MLTQMILRLLPQEHSEKSEIVEREKKNLPPKAKKREPIDIALLYPKGPSYVTKK